MLCMLLLVMVAMQRHWPTVLIATLIGLATATRSVGVALLPSFALYLWHDAGVDTPLKASRVEARPLSCGTARWTRCIKRVARALVLMTVACWGLIAFVGYQAWAFHDPLAFAKDEMNWKVRPMPATLVERGAQLVTLEPIRATYTAGSPCYWKTGSPREVPLLNLFFANPIYFVGGAVLLGIGAAKRWLDPLEWVLGALLLLIPYVLQANRQGMISQARFASIDVPAYIVAGRLLSRIPKGVAMWLLGTAGLLLGLYAAMFVSGYDFF